MRLRGKRVFISAAGQGIGRETSILFAREGAQVFATDINELALKSLRNEVKGINISILDVTDAVAIEKYFDANNSFDIVFNCAGYVAAGTILDCSKEDWRRSISVNVDSMFEICRQALPQMVANGNGAIINMSSIASSVKGIPNRFAYTATKAAVIGLTKSIAADFVTQGIRCNAICPGTVHSPSLDQRLADTGDYNKALKDFVDRQPMGRIGSVSEIAALALYLASDESSFTTGAIHVIDGGWVN